jgi:ABC-type nitrate/sulfonate/bicarbonate transport system substrate-binding protein
MLWWEPERGRPYGLLAKQYGVLPEVKKTLSGGAAFEMLAKGQVGVALVPGDLLSQLGRDCRRVCLLSKLYVTGASTRKIETVSDLKGKTFGYLSGSAFGTRLNHVSRAWGVPVPPPLALATPKDFVHALLAGRIDGMVGSEPSVSQIRRAVGRSLEIFPIPQGLLGSFEMHVAVNLRLAHPASVRAYLSGLEQTTAHANARKSVAAFQAEIASRFNMDQWDVRNILTNTVYSLGEFEPETILTLWEREVVELRRA